MPKSSQPELVRQFNAALRTIFNYHAKAVEDAGNFAYRTNLLREEKGGSWPIKPEGEPELGRWAVRWLNDIELLADHLRDVAIRAERHWPARRTKPGTITAGITVGERSKAEVCDHCKEPIPDIQLPNGRPAIARMDGKPMHRNTCYHVVYRANRANGQNRRSESTT